MFLSVCLTKTGLLEIALKLSENKARIVFTEGTAIYLRKKGLKVTSVSELTGFPEVMDGRVRTLHPHIHIPLLARPLTKGINHF